MTSIPAWKPLDHNQILQGEGFYVSYNAHAGHQVFTDMANLLGGDVKDGEETALYDGDSWRILEGDFRDEYASAFHGGIEACIAVYDLHKGEHRSNWSTD